MSEPRDPGGGNEWLYIGPPGSADLKLIGPIDALNQRLDRLEAEIAWLRRVVADLAIVAELPNRET